MHAVGFIHAVGICAFEVRMEWQQENNKKIATTTWNYVCLKRAFTGEKVRRRITPQMQSRWSRTAGQTKNQGKEHRVVHDKKCIEIEMKVKWVFGAEYTA